jgi:hypothetical protein
MAVQRPAWAPAEHRRFLPAFQAAARTLLRAAHSGSAGRAATGCQQGRQLQQVGPEQPSLLRLLGCLPQEVVLHIVGLAAYPLSAWAEAADFGLQDDNGKGKRDAVLSESY